mmetsp:Transcript_2787/g.4214  ORF Transcript_2787/g.4214 Transcript_2787/m.4214 type:complete len:434 (+) Transcript_2787:372-1673(+)
MSESLKMTVNVSLCGSIPRSEMMSCSSSHRSRLDQESTWSTSPSSTASRDASTHTCTDQVIAMAASSLVRKVSNECIVLSSQVIEAPSWAVPARGEAILEPISDSRRLHPPIDLTSKAVFHIGRSDMSDLQLLHCASSRLHAILFHHPNGSCYVVDCGSAHGTFVNGVRVKSTVALNGVVPHRLRKGALIRFGGPGAPSFILKSFSVTLGSLIQNLDGTKTFSCKRNIVVDKEPPSSSSCPHLEGAAVNSDYSLDALVTLNTRLNSVASVATLLPPKNDFCVTSAQLRAKSSAGFTFLKKRSLVSFDEDQDVDVDQRAPKKLKMSSSTDSSDSNDSSNIAIVSPSRQKPVLDFHFDLMDDRPVVSPNPFEDIANTLDLRTAVCKSMCGILAVPLTLPSTSNKKKMKSVSFSAQPPELFFPPTVTPDSTSDNEE